ncbi:MAG: 6,7-dimethyl-8-ribityllumazine synthase [Patescibacteria group bacterium]
MQKINKKIEYVNGKNLKACIVVSRWNNEITDELLMSALETLKNCKVNDKNIKIVTVAGAMEIPFALQKMAQPKKYDFLVALGCVIKGETPHFDYVCKMAQEGVLKVSLENNIPIGFGVLTVNNLSQAQKRIHVGGEAVLAALELSLLK